MGRKSAILLSAFRGTSAERLVQDAKQCKILLLPNDKVKDSKILVQLLSAESFDYVISIGQRPNIKDKVHIEAVARDGEQLIETDFDCQRLLRLFEEKGFCTKLSYNAGTSYCNRLYLNGLRHIAENGLDTNMVFVHIPFLKNISDFEEFQKKFLNVILDDLP